PTSTAAGPAARPSSCGGRWPTRTRRPPAPPATTTPPASCPCSRASAGRAPPPRPSRRRPPGAAAAAAPAAAADRLMALGTFDRARALAELGDREFDVLVVGGGVTGCGVALDASSRGLRTALVER